MPDKHGGIGSEGLEQGGPSLGNDYSRPDMSIGNAGDALATANTTELKGDDDDNLAIDQESSRNLSTETDSTESSDDELLEDDFDDDEEDEDFDELDEADEDVEEESQLERGI